MKKTIISVFVLIAIGFISYSYVNPKPVFNSSMNTYTSMVDKYYNASFSDIDKSLGSPYHSVYYINTDKLDITNISNFDIDKLKEFVYVISSYKINDNPNYNFIHLYFKDGVVKDAALGDYNLSNSSRFTNFPELKNYNYKVEHFKESSGIYKKYFTMGNAKVDFKDKTIKQFNDNYNIKNSSFIASTKDSSKRIYFYSLLNNNLTPDKQYLHPNYSSNKDVKNDTVNPLNNNINLYNASDSTQLDYSDSAVLISTKGDIIKNIEVVNNKFIYDMINKNLLDN